MARRFTQQTATFLVFIVIILSFSIDGSTTPNVIIGRSLDDFGNPLKDDANKCRRNGKPSYICDPDSLLSTAEGEDLDTQITDIFKSTCCPCPKQSSGFLVTFALMKKLRIPNSSPGNDVPNQNDEHGSYLNALLSEAKDLATGLIQKWKIGNCSETVMVVFSRNDNILYTVAESTAASKLTNDLIGDIASSVRSKLTQNVTVGLTELLKDYKAVFLNTYKRRTNLDPSDLPVAYPVLGAAGNPLNVCFCLNTLATLFITVLLHFLYPH